jgi:hypothetical protein
MTVPNESHEKKQKIDDLKRVAYLTVKCPMTKLAGCIQNGSMDVADEKSYTNTIQGMLGPFTYFAIKYVPRILPNNCKKPVYRFRTNNRKTTEIPMLKRCLRAGWEEGIRM